MLFGQIGAPVATMYVIHLDRAIAEQLESARSKGATEKQLAKLASIMREEAYSRAANFVSDAGPNERS